MKGTWQVYADTGYPPMDEEHRALSGMVCHLLVCASRDDVKRARAVMVELVAAVESHFAHEDRWMFDSHYPELIRHRTAHQQFLAEAGRHARELQEFGLTPEFQRWAMGHLAEWFHFHILSVDVALGRFLQERDRQAAPGSPKTTKPRHPA